MTICTKCSYDWDAPPEHAVAVIGGFPEHLPRLLLNLGLQDSDGPLRTRPAAEEWPPLEYMAHTADAIAWHAERINRVLTENRPTLDPFGWDAHTATHRYDERRLTDVLTTIRGTCTSLTAVLKTLPAPAWQQEGTASNGSPRTITHLAARAAHEAQHHLRDIAQGLQAPGRAQIRDGTRSQTT
ncbi:DinB family protein [Kribbella sp. NPDC049174]|uniref:DinB family protein n=1 Tax=Kribbella sp. NPDC049174 TaxID=3364112 RepID=UPI00371FDC37